jgi:hypothetical protein
MIEIRTRPRVPGLTGRKVSDFPLNPTDESDRRWWPGTHLEFHVVRKKPGHIGEVVLMDELVGRRRLRMKGTVVHAMDEHAKKEFPKLLDIQESTREEARPSFFISKSFSGHSALLRVPLQSTRIFQR